MSIAATAIIYPNVTLGANVTIEDFCIIGCPPTSGAARPTVIGSNSHIRSNTVIYSGNTIGTNFQTGNKANIRENNIIGNNVSIGTLSVLEYATCIGDNVRIHSQAFIPEYSIIENNCWIGPNVVLTNSKYPCTHDSKAKLKGPTLRTGAIIGANVTILPGVVIAEKTLIGAGSVVVSNTKKASLYIGNPAKFVKYLTEIEEYNENTTL
ncbi:MAG: transferase [Legionellales bacterium]|nr:MAG: transferase [Legionellales bacterium]